MKRIRGLTLVLVILFSCGQSYSYESKEIFLETFMDKSTYCQNELDASKCKCVGEIWYSSLSDKDKGLLMLYFDAQKAFPEKSNEELSRDFESFYDISKEDKQEIREKWNELESEFKKQCGYKSKKRVRLD